MSPDLDLVNDRATPDLVARLIGAEPAGRGAWWCPGHDDRSGRKPSFSLAEKNGRVVGHCFACDLKGNAAQLVAQVKGITLPEAATVLGETLGLLAGAYNGPPQLRRGTPRTPGSWPPEYVAPSDRLLAYGDDLWRSCVPLTEPGCAWLCSRGIGEWANAILRTATDETAAIAGLVSIAGWVAVPWVTPARELVCVRFRRPWNGEGSNKLSPRTPEGVEACFPSPGLLRRPGAPEGGRLWIVEGETDALTVLEHDPSASVWMLSTARGWRSSWLRLLPPRGEIVVALDEDKAGLEGTKKIIEDLGRWKRQAGAAVTVFRPKMRPGEDLSEAVQRIARERAASPSLNTLAADPSDAPPVQDPHRDTQAAQEPNPHPTPEPSPWPADALDLLGWLGFLAPGSIPAGAALRRGERIADPALFLAALRRDVAAGPRGPRAGVLLDDLLLLKAIVERGGIG